MRINKKRERGELNFHPLLLSPLLSPLSIAACLALREPVELSGDSAEECCQRALGPGGGETCGGRGVGGEMDHSLHA